MPAPKPKLNFQSLLSKIHGVIPVKEPDSGLIDNNGNWYLVFYPGVDRTRTASLSLHTKDFVEAQQLRDRLYKAAKKAGRGGQTYLEKMATEVLANPESMQGFKFKVLMGGNTEHHSIEEAVAVRAQRAKAILARRKMA